MNPIQQILHILRKDMRHLYPEISVSCCLVALFAWIEPASWPGYLAKMPYPGLQFNAPILIGMLLHVLIPISWLVLISRVVHDESLVGDQQFWVTRPYTWYSLLAAKLVFIAAFLCGPFLLAQMFMVHYAGLPVLTNLPGLLANMGMIFLLFLLPFLVIASVTSSFGPMILILLAFLLYLGLVGLVGSWLLGARALPPQAVVGWLMLLGLLPAGILVYQYIRRKTRLSQIFILATALVMFALLLITPSDMLFARAFPQLSAVSATFDLDPMKQQPTSAPPLVVSHNMILTLPLQVSDMPPGEMMQGEAVRAELTSASGFHWTSQWQGFSNMRTGGTLKVNVLVPRTIIERIGSETVSARLTLAVQHLKPNAPLAVQIADADHIAPDGGVCSLEQGIPIPVCRYALRSPLTLVDAEVVPGECPADGGETAPRTFPSKLIIGPQNSLFSFDPVFALTPELGRETRRSLAPNQLFSICPGARMQMTTSHESGGEQIHVEQTGIELAPYLQRVEQHRPVQAAQEPSDQ